MERVAIVLAAGRGERLGSSEPKAFVEVAGHPVLEHSARALAAAPSVDAVLPVLPAGMLDGAESLRAAWDLDTVLLDPINGGKTRQQSVYNAVRWLLEYQPAVCWVWVHDAARCFVSAEDAERVLAAAAKTGAALPVIPIHETVKRVVSGHVSQTEDRRELFLAQTPQVFRLEILREALDKAARDHVQGTDCASLVERLGVEVNVVDGRRENWKLTEAGDLDRAERQFAESRQ